MPVADAGPHGDDLMNGSILACERAAVEGRPKPWQPQPAHAVDFGRLKGNSVASP